MRKMLATIAVLSIVAFLFAASASSRVEASQPNISAAATASSCQPAGYTTGRLCILRCNLTDTCGICCWQHDHWVCS